jgi:hypothetical protein
MKEPPKRYQGTVFDRKQIDVLQDLLGFKYKQKAVLFAHLITVSYYEYMHEIDLRQKIPNTKNSKRQLKSIAEKSRDLARILEEHPISQELVRRRAASFEEWQAKLHKFEDEDGVIQLWKLQEDRTKKLGELIEALKVVSDEARFFLDNDDEFRRRVHLPPVKDAEKSAVRVHLWPSLFVIWEDAGKSIASGEGPLHKFVTLVHQACGIGSVSASTLGAAAAEWNQKSLRIKSKWEQR